MKTKLKLRDQVKVKRGFWIDLPCPEKKGDTRLVISKGSIFSVQGITRGGKHSGDEWEKNDTTSVTIALKIDPCLTLQIDVNPKDVEIVKI